MNKSITTKNILKQLGKRWFLCVVFGFDLVVLVALSEAMRSMFLGLTPDSSNLNNWITVFLWVLVLVPAILLPLWYLNPYAIKKLLVTFGLSEEPPIVEKQPQKAESQDEKKTTVAKQAITFPSKWTLRVLVMVTLLAVIFVLSYWFSKGNDLARMFLPTFIGLAITFIFFVAFFDLREELEWKRIKEEVYYMIGLELGTIFYEILNYVENGFVTSSYLMSLNKQETRRKAFLSALIELKDAKELKLNDAEWKLMMEKRTPLDGFSVAAKGLNDVEVKYSKFLSPQQTLSLIRTQYALRAIDHLKQLYASPMYASPMVKPLLSSMMPTLLSFSFKKLLEEVYNMDKMEIDCSNYAMLEPADK